VVLIGDLVSSTVFLVPGAKVTGAGLIYCFRSSLLTVVLIGDLVSSTVFLVPGAKVTSVFFLSSFLVSTFKSFYPRAGA
jgi:hypothetical protein